MLTKFPGIMRRCLRDPIPEIHEAAETLAAAIDAHLAGDRLLASDLIVKTNTSALREYIESLWGRSCSYLPKVPPRQGNAPLRVESRMPSATEKLALHGRDGFHCRFCGIPVIRAEVRKELSRLYPELGLWGRTNDKQHSALQVMWAQYDHLVPHSWGGSNELDNLVVTCAGCNYARVDYLLDEVGLSNPLDFPPTQSSWTGLEHLLQPTRQARKELKLPAGK